jgi:DNA-binding CsgD family transcriptional regulator
MTLRELSRAQRRLMDEFARDPDASNDELAHRLGRSVGYVEQLFTGVFATYRVTTRTGAYAVHIRRRGSRVRRQDNLTEPMGL